LSEPVLSTASPAPTDGRPDMEKIVAAVETILRDAGKPLASEEIQREINADYTAGKPGASYTAEGVLDATLDLGAGATPPRFVLVSDGDKKKSYFLPPLVAPVDDATRARRVLAFGFLAEGVVYSEGSRPDIVDGLSAFDIAYAFGRANRGTKLPGPNNVDIDADPVISAELLKAAFPEKLPDVGVLASLGTLTDVVLGDLKLLESKGLAWGNIEPVKIGDKESPTLLFRMTSTGRSVYREGGAIAWCALLESATPTRDLIAEHKAALETKAQRISELAVEIGMQKTEIGRQRDLILAYESWFRVQGVRTPEAVISKRRPGKIPEGTPVEYTDIVQIDTFEALDALVREELALDAYAARVDGELGQAKSAHSMAIKVIAERRAEITEAKRTRERLVKKKVWRRVDGGEIVTISAEEYEVGRELRREPLSGGEQLVLDAPATGRDVKWEPGSTIKVAPGATFTTPAPEPMSPPAIADASAGAAAATTHTPGEVIAKTGDLVPAKEAVTDVVRAAEPLVTPVLETTAPPKESPTPKAPVLDESAGMAGTRPSAGKPLDLFGEDAADPSAAGKGKGDGKAAAKKAANAAEKKPTIELTVPAVRRAVTSIVADAVSDGIERSKVLPAFCDMSGHKPTDATGKLIDATIDLVIKSGAIVETPVEGRGKVLTLATKDEAGAEKKDEGKPTASGGNGKSGTGKATITAAAKTAKKSGGQGKDRAESSAK
jgi:hypothetical protein